MKKPKQVETGRIPGTVNANIQMPWALHNEMKMIRRRRHEAEGADVKLCRIYREAVEQYVNSNREQRSSNAARKAPRNTA